MIDSPDAVDRAQSSGSTIQSTRTSRQAIFNMSILFCINLLNYMDRFTLPGVLDSIKSYFNLSNTHAGLISTVFISTYMLLAPVFGYLGDRYNRPRLMAMGVAVWSLFTFLGSISKPSHVFWFYLCRGLVGIGEASYSCIAPSVIGDLYDGPMRSKMLGVYYLAIPLGSGLGYIVGSKVALWMGSWQWALRITPIFGAIAVIVLLLVVKDPQRGNADHAFQLEKASYKQDIVFLLKNHTYLFTTISFTAVSFVLGVMTWWLPHYMKLAYQIKQRPIENVAFLFGVITCLGGLFGVIIGTLSSARLKRKTLRADPLVCGFSVITAIPFLFLSILLANKVTWLSWLCIWIGTTAVCCTWPLIADIILFVVIPAKRATAEAIQILISHLFGDATSPYIIGQISDIIQHHRQAPLSTGTGMGVEPLRNASSAVIDEFISMQYSLYINTFIALIGGVGFIITSFFIAHDRQMAEALMHGAAGNAENVKLENDDANSSEVSDPFIEPHIP